jgi:hypothetical protein
VRRAGDRRTLTQLQASCRCAHCFARASDGELDIFVPDFGNVRPGYILEGDGEFHPRSATRGGRRSAGPKLHVVSGTGTSGPRLTASTPPAPPSGPARMGDATYKSLEATLLAVAAVGAVGVIAFAAWLGGLTLQATSRLFDVVTSPPALAGSFDPTNAVDRANFCQGRDYLIDIRGADIPEDIREQRRQYIANCIRG